MSMSGVLCAWCVVLCPLSVSSFPILSPHCFCVAYSVLCCAALLCVAVCVVCVCVCLCVLGEGGGGGGEDVDRVYVQTPSLFVFENVPVCTGTTSTCVSTCGRGAGAHRDVLNAHTEGVFSASDHTTTVTHNHTATHNNTQHNTTTHNTTHHIT